MKFLIYTFDKLPHEEYLENEKIFDDYNQAKEEVIKLGSNIVKQLSNYDLKRRVSITSHIAYCNDNITDKNKGYYESISLGIEDSYPKEYEVYKTEVIELYKNLYL